MKRQSTSFASSEKPKSRTSIAQAQYGDPPEIGLGPSDMPPFVEREPGQRVEVIGGRKAIFEPVKIDGLLSWKARKGLRVVRGYQHIIGKDFWPLVLYETL